MPNYCPLEILKKCIRDIFQNHRQRNSFGDNGIYRLKRDTLYIYIGKVGREPLIHANSLPKPSNIRRSHVADPTFSPGVALSPRNGTRPRGKHANNVHSLWGTRSQLARRGSQFRSEPSRECVRACTYTRALFAARATIHALQVPPRHSSVNETTPWCSRTFRCLTF